MPKENQIHTYMYRFESREPCVSWVIITKFAMMVKMLLEMLYQKSASDVLPASSLALKPRAKGTVAKMRVRRTSVTRRRGSVVGDLAGLSVGMLKGLEG